MPSSPSRTSAAAGCPGRPPTGGAIAASTPSSGRLHRRSGTSGSSAGIFPAITARGDCRKTTRCPSRRPRLLRPRASPPRGVPSCSSDPRRSSRPAPRHGSTSPLLHCCPWRSCRDDDCRSSSSDAMPPQKSFLMKYASLSWGVGGGGTGITKEKCERGEMFSSTEGWEIHRTRMQRGLGKEKPQLTLRRRSTEA